MSQTNPSLDSVFAPTQHQVSCDIAGEAVILNLHDGTYYGLNAIAAQIWELLQKPRPIRVIRDELIALHPEVDTRQCTDELLELLCDLIELQLIEPVHAAAH